MGDERNNKGCSMHYEFFSRYSSLLVVAISFSDISVRSNLLAFALLVNMIKWPVFLFLNRIKVSFDSKRRLFSAEFSFDKHDATLRIFVSLGSSHKNAPLITRLENILTFNISAGISRSTVKIHGITRITAAAAAVAARRYTHPLTHINTRSLSRISCNRRIDRMGKVL